MNRLFRVSNTVKIKTTSKQVRQICRFRVLHTPIFHYNSPIWFLLAAQQNITIVNYFIVSKYKDQL